MSYRNWLEKHGGSIARIEEQSIDVIMVEQLATDYEATHITPITIEMSALDWMWLGVAIDLLAENLCLIKGDEAKAHGQILNAMGSLGNYVV